MYDPIHFADTLHRLTRARIHHQFHIPELPLSILVKKSIFIKLPDKSLYLGAAVFP